MPYDYLMFDRLRGMRASHNSKASRQYFVQSKNTVSLFLSWYLIVPEVFAPENIPAGFSALSEGKARNDNISVDMVYFLNVDGVSRVRRAQHERVLVLLQTLSSVNTLSLLSEQSCVPKMEIVYLKDGFSRFTPYTRHWREFSEHPVHRDWECRAVGRLGNALAIDIIVSSGGHRWALIV